jgi:hypothetical protein
MGVDGRRLRGWEWNGMEEGLLRMKHDDDDDGHEEIPLLLELISKVDVHLNDVHLRVVHLKVDVDVHLKFEVAMDVQTK